MTNEVDGFLEGQGGRSARFPNIGDQVWGEVVNARVVQQTDFDSGALLFWDDGNPRMQLVITLATQEQEDDEDDGVRRVYARGQMATAIAKAVRATGAKLRPGGQLVVRYTQDGPAPSRKGMSPPKIYFAKYEPPEPGALGAQDLESAAPWEDAPPPGEQDAPAPDDLPF